MAPRPRGVQRRDHPERALFARIKAVYDGARRGRARQPSSCAWSSRSTTRFARHGAALDAKGRRRASRRSTSAWRRCTRSSARTSSHDEETDTLVARQGGRSRRAARHRSAQAPREAAEAQEAPGQVGDHEHALVGRAVPDVLRRGATCARRSGGCGSAAATTRGAHDNKPVDHRDPAAARRDARSCSASRRTRTGSSTTTWRKTPDAAMALMMKVWKAAVARVQRRSRRHAEVADDERRQDQDRAVGLPLLRREGAQGEVRPRSERGEAVPPARQDARRACSGRRASSTASSSSRSRACRSITPTSRVYEVTRDGKHVGLWYFDPYARDGKQLRRVDERVPHAGASSRTRSTPIVSNNSNFVKGKAGEPVLISWDDAVTMFHEFGHALHGLISNVQLPDARRHQHEARLRRVPEPAQRALAARRRRCWASSRVHYQTGKPIPKELVAKIEKAKQLQPGLRDRRVPGGGDLRPEDPHRAGRTSASTPGEFEKRDDEGDRHAGGDRDASPADRSSATSSPATATRPATTSYIWADTLTADAAEAFAGSRRLLRQAEPRSGCTTSIMSVGNSIPPDEAFRKFRGRDVDTNALMRDRGFPVA